MMERQLRLDRHVSESENSYQAKNLRPRQHRGKDRSRSLSLSRSLNRSRSRQGSIPEAPRRPCRLSRAPSPPPLPNPSPFEYIEACLGDEEVKVTCTTQHAAVDRHGRPTTVTRKRRSRSRCTAGSHRSQSFLRPGNEMVVAERETVSPADYEWYDTDGMRVRVREI